MAKISIEEIIDYSFCPMLYVLKYTTSEYKNININLLEKYDKDIHKVIYKCLNEIKDNKQIALKDIKTFWGKEWIKDKRKTHLAFGDTLLTKDSYNVKRKKGLELLMNFFYKFSSEVYTPLIINKKYNIKINNKLTLTNTIELVREMEDGTIELITFITDKNNNTANNLKIMADYYVCKGIFKNKNIQHTVFNLEKNNCKSNIVIEKKIEFFKYNIFNIYKAIYNKLYYINSGTHCYNCIYKSSCNKRMNSIIDKIFNKEV